jgi:glutamate-5-semialdehyde dehydrogenase
MIRIAPGLASLDHHASKTAMNIANPDPAIQIASMAARARAAAAVLARASSDDKARALLAAAAAIRAASADIIAANAADMTRAVANGLSAAMLDRLKLDAGRVEAMAAGVAAVAALEDPVGCVIDETRPANGLVLRRVRVPIGVIGIIYESRPNVTADAAALCIGSGNAVILRGGSEATQSNRAIHAAMVAGLTAAGLPADTVQLVGSADRALVGAMLTADGAIDLIIPRGGKSLVARVQAEARVPVLAHLDGINHVYVDASADQAMAEAITVNAKLRRTGVCGAMETLLIDRAYTHAAALIAALRAAGCEVRGDPAARVIDPSLSAATAADWDTEYLDAIASVAIVDGVEDAMAHIAAHGSHHTDAIVAADADIAERFLAGVDSAIVLWNASTQFADGGEFGLGAEIGIATGRLHARGPVALEGLTTYKWVGHGVGQIRP